MRAPAHGKYQGLIGNVCRIKSLPRSHDMTRSEQVNTPQRHQWSVSQEGSRSFETFGLKLSFFTDMQPWTDY